MKVVVIGAGQHCLRFHLPALKYILTHQHGRITLAGICDIDEARAKEAAREFNAEAAFTDYGAMIDTVKPDVCLAITPFKATKAIARDIMERGIPLLMEKPLGASIAEAREIAERWEQRKTPVMVSMNRRFEASMQKAAKWLEGRKIRYIRAIMTRCNRTESYFTYETGIHLIDTVRFLCREPAVDQCDLEVLRPADPKNPNVSWSGLNFSTKSGIRGRADILPTAGCVSEAYEVHGDNFSLCVRSGFCDSGDLYCWESGELVEEHQLRKEMPRYIRSGCLAETEAFLEAIENGRMPQPNPAQVLASTELCQKLLDQVP